jgi:hypothetical protein
LFDEEEDDEAGFEGLRVWAKSREAALITRTGNTNLRKIRLTARILTQRTSTGHVEAADLTRPAERSSAGLAMVSLSFCGDDCIDRLDLDRRVDEGEGCTAERLVLAENQSQIAANGSLGHRDGNKNVGLYIFLNV